MQTLWRRSWILGVLLAGCTGTAEPGSDAGDDEGGLETRPSSFEVGSVMLKPDAPSSETLCAIRFYASELEDAEAVLGDPQTRTQASTIQVQLVYEYANAALLRLTFSDVLIDAAAYNMPFPQCWLDQKKEALSLPSKHEPEDL
jgi:hypothetical protein